MPAHEIGLVVQAAGGDREAFDGLARACRPWLLRYCLQLCRNQEGAQDLAQETLCRALAALVQLQEPARFRAWLGRIALNLHRGHCRRTARASEILLPPERLAEILPDTWSEPVGTWEALSRIDPASRELLLLFHVEGLSYLELAERMSLSPAAVKSRLHRTRERVRREVLGTRIGGSGAALPPRPPRM